VLSLATGKMKFYSCPRRYLLLTTVRLAWSMCSN